MINKLKKLFKRKSVNYILVVNDSELCYRFYYTKEYIVFPSLEEANSRKKKLEEMYPMSEYKIYKCLQ